MKKIKGFVNNLGVKKMQKIAATHAAESPNVKGVKDIENNFDSLINKTKQ